MKLRPFTILTTLSLIIAIGGSVAVPYVGTANAAPSFRSPLVSLRSLFAPKEKVEHPVSLGKARTMNVAVINGFAGRGDTFTEKVKSAIENVIVIGNKEVPVEPAPESDRAPDPEVAPSSSAPTTSPTPPPPPPAPTPYGKIAIPSIGVSAHIEAVGVDTKGNMGVPKDARNVAWYTGGVKPGEIGNAVIAGHLDTASGRAAVFFRLKQLRPGDTIHVDQPDGTSPKFVIDRVQTVPVTDAAAFQSVFGTSERAQLVLITCAGKWNQQARTYADRLLVFAHLEEHERGILSEESL